MRKRLQPGGFVPRLSDGMHAIGGYSTSSGVPSELRSVCWVLRNSAGVVPIVEHYARTAHLFQGEASLPTRDFERLYWLATAGHCRSPFHVVAEYLAVAPRSPVSAGHFRGFSVDRCSPPSY